MKNYSIIFFLTIASFSILSFQPAILPVTMQQEMLVQEIFDKKLDQGQTDTVQWMTMSEAIEKSKSEERKIIINVYKDWCAWCKQMEDVTFQNQDIVHFINDNFYAVKLNAEQEEDIEFKEKVYQFVQSGKRGYHELAVEMLRGRMSFPTTVFLNEKMDIIQPLSGYKTPEEFEQIVTYFAQNHYKKTPWSAFQRQYKSGATKKD